MQEWLDANVIEGAVWHEGTLVARVPLSDPSALRTLVARLVEHRLVEIRELIALPVPASEVVYAELDLVDVDVDIDLSADFDPAQLSEAEAQLLGGLVHAHLRTLEHLDTWLSVPDPLGRVQGLRVHNPPAPGTWTSQESLAPVGVVAAPPADPEALYMAAFFDADAPAERRRTAETTLLNLPHDVAGHWQLRLLGKTEHKAWTLTRAVEWPELQPVLHTLALERADRVGAVLGWLALAEPGDDLTQALHQPPNPFRRELGLQEIVLENLPRLRPALAEALHAELRTEGMRLLLGEPLRDARWTAAAIYGVEWAGGDVSDLGALAEHPDAEVRRRLGFLEQRNVLRDDVDLSPAPGFEGRQRQWMDPHYARARYLRDGRRDPRWDDTVLEAHRLYPERAAEPHYERAVARGCDDAVVLYRAAYFRHLTDGPSARPLFEACRDGIAAQYPDSPYIASVHEALGLLDEQAGALEAAVRCYEAAVRGPVVPDKVGQRLRVARARQRASAGPLLDTGFLRPFPSRWHAAQVTGIAVKGNRAMSADALGVVKLWEVQEDEHFPELLAVTEVRAHAGPTLLTWQEGHFVSEGPDRTLRWTVGEDDSLSSTPSARLGLTPTPRAETWTVGPVRVQRSGGMFAHGTTFGTDAIECVGIDADTGIILHADATHRLKANRWS